MRALLAVPVTLLLATGCTGSDKGKANGPCDFQFGSGGPVVQFHEDTACAPNPWPSDRLLVAGRVTVPESRVSYTIPDGEEFDAARSYLQATADTLDAAGWSTIAPIHIVLDREPDLATVPTGVFFYRFTGGTPADDANGRPSARSREFQKYLAGEPLAEDVALYEGAGLPTDQIALAFTFTTGTNTADMVAIRDLIFAAAPEVHLPAFEDPSTFSGLEEGYFLSGSPEFAATIAGMTAGSNLAGVANGSFDAWNFRDASGTFSAALVAGTGVPPVERLDFRLTIPEGAVPVGGFPVVIYGHGLGGQNTDVYRWGDELAKYGFAVIGISSVHHGYRGTVPEFFDWGSLPKTREHFRQTTADHLQLLKAVREGNADGLPPFDLLNADSVSYFGISLGGIMGSSFLSLAPYNDRGLLVVPGGHLSRELYAEEVGGTYFYPFLANRAQISSSDAEFIPFVKGFEMLVQLGLDKVDPVNYAAHVITPGTQFPGSDPKRVLQTISIDDTWVPNDANEALQRALGIPTLTASVTNIAGVSGAWRIDDSNFPQVSGDEPHGYFSSLCEAQEMGFNWLLSGGTEVTDPTTITCP
jgi:pimeloyl-ACP methyl ester carboxylesterase